MEKKQMPFTKEDAMRLAIAWADKAVQMGEIPVGAVVVKDGEILSAACNRRETDNDPCAHAEILAMRQAAKKLGTWHLTGCTLYVTMEPCPMCAGAMVMGRLTACTFGAADEKQGCCGSIYDLPQDPAFAHHVQVRGGMLADECAQRLRDFFAHKRKKQV